jgi:hypothetical protein
MKAMPVPSKLSIRVPDSCRACDGMGGVRLEQTLRGSAVHFSWCCVRCNHSWPLDDQDVATPPPAGDRRRGVRDRRRVPR